MKLARRGPLLASWALAALAFGCAEDTIERDVCGNGLVELGEDCDSDDPRCIECSIECASTEECLAYDPSGGTAGFVCGTDGLCHAPSGTFDEPHELTIPVTSLAITDVGGDGIGDVIVQAQTSVSVVFGAPAGFGFEATSLLTPSALGPASFGDLDLDLARDVLLPTADGIVAYTTKNGTPSPFPFPQELGLNLGTPRYVNPVRANFLAAIGTQPQDSALSMIVLDVKPALPVVVGAGALCGADVSAFDPEAVDTFDRSPGHQLVAMTLRPPGGPATLCMVAIDEVVPERFDITPVVFTPDLPPTSRPVLARVRSDACPSLFVQDAGGLVEYPPATSNGACKLGPRRLIAGAPGATPVGAVSLSPAIAGLGPQALALTTGIYGFRTSTEALDELYRSDRELGSVRTTDLDLDGDLDVVASGDRAVALDVLYRVPLGYLPFRFATDSTVTTFRIGDYDGNTLPDLAYVERVQLDAVTRERLMIAFGTQDQLLPGVSVGTFERVISLIPSAIEDSVDQFGLIDDLAVLFEVSLGAEENGEPEVTTQLALLHGSPQRTMLAFYDPRLVRLRSSFRAVVAGSFGGQLGNDVLAVEQADDAVNLWLTTGAIGGNLSSIEITPTDASSMKMCGGVSDSLDPVEVFCLDEARLVAWPVGPLQDIVVGIDRKHELLIVDPTRLTEQRRIPGAVIAPADSIAKDLRVLVGPDGPRLLVSLGPIPDAPRPDKIGAVNLCTVEPSGPSVTCVDVGAEIAQRLGTPVTCFDAAQATMAPARRFEPPDTLDPELVVLCREPGGDQMGLARNQLYRLPLDLSRVTSVFGVDGTVDGLAIGDLTGDAVPDLVLVDRSFGVPKLKIFPQCTSRDVGCEAGVVVSPPSSGTGMGGGS